jgi:hypothetical protein
MTAINFIISSFQSLGVFCAPVTQAYRLYTIIALLGIIHRPFIYNTVFQRLDSVSIFRMRLFDFFNLPNLSSRTMALGLTQPSPEMSNRNINEGR